MSFSEGIKQANRSKGFHTKEADPSDSEGTFPHNHAKICAPKPHIATTCILDIIYPLAHFTVRVLTKAAYDCKHLVIPNCSHYTYRSLWDYDSGGADRGVQCST